jgi:hypothetical protein
VDLNEQDFPTSPVSVPSAIFAALVSLIEAYRTQL